jgi:hypothetical protein
MKKAFRKHAPVDDLIVVFLWSMAGLAITALVAACYPGADLAQLAGILAVAE